MIDSLHAHEGLRCSKGVCFRCGSHPVSVASDANVDSPLTIWGSRSLAQQEVPRSGKDGDANPPWRHRPNAERPLSEAVLLDWMCDLEQSASELGSQAGLEAEPALVRAVLLNTGLDVDAVLQSIELGVAHKMAGSKSWHAEYPGGDLAYEWSSAGGVPARLEGLVRLEQGNSCPKALRAAVRLKDIPPRTSYSTRLDECFTLDRLKAAVVNGAQDEHRLASEEDAFDFSACFFGRGEAMRTWEQEPLRKAMEEYTQFFLKPERRFVGDKLSKAGRSDILKYVSTMTLLLQRGTSKCHQEVSPQATCDADKWGKKKFKMLDHGELVLLCGCKSRVVLTTARLTSGAEGPLSYSAVHCGDKNGPMSNVHWSDIACKVGMNLAAVAEWMHVKLGGQKRRGCAVEPGNLTGLGVSGDSLSLGPESGPERWFKATDAWARLNPALWRTVCAMMDVDVQWSLAWSHPLEPHPLSGLPDLLFLIEKFHSRRGHCSLVCYASKWQLCRGFGCDAYTTGPEQHWSAYKSARGFMSDCSPPTYVRPAWLPELLTGCVGWVWRHVLLLAVWRCVLPLGPACVCCRWGLRDHVKVFC